jgi:uncharacterized iron-regulated membrane protein
VQDVAARAPGTLAFMLAAALMPLFSVTGILLYLSRRRRWGASFRASDLSRWLVEHLMVA